MGDILLRIVEGARIALYRAPDSAVAENIPTRTDLFRYDGGYGWGYGGTGANALSFAIAGKIYEYDDLKPAELATRARLMLDHVISTLDPDQEHTLSVLSLRQLAADGKRTDSVR